MENRLSKIADSIPDLVKNSHLSISLEGWPAAVTAIALFGSAVAIYVIKVSKAL